MEEVMREEGRETPPAPKKKRGPRLGKKKKWLVLVLVLAVAAIAAVKLLGGRESEAAVTYQETAAAKRDITRSLSSSGTLEPADSYTVNTLVSGEILSDTFEEGDLVEKDQLLYTLDSSDAATSQNQAQNSSPAASSSGRPLPGLWWESPPSFWRMSHRRPGFPHQPGGAVAAAKDP